MVQLLIYLTVWHDYDFGGRAENGNIYVTGALYFPLHFRNGRESRPSVLCGRSGLSSVKRGIGVPDEVRPDREPLWLGDDLGVRCGRRVRPELGTVFQGEKFRGWWVSQGVVVVAPSTLGRVDRMEWWVSSTESGNGWASAMSSKYSGYGLGGWWGAAVWWSVGDRGV